jgi:hypothetical protein
MACYYLTKQHYQTYIGSALKDIDSKLRNLPNMRPAEKWIPPFDEDDGTVNFLWPHYKEVKGNMLEVSPILQPQTPTTTEVVPWKAVEQGTIVRVKVTLSS